MSCRAETSQQEKPRGRRSPWQWARQRRNSRSGKWEISCEHRWGRPPLPRCRYLRTARGAAHNLDLRRRPLIAPNDADLPPPQPARGFQRRMAVHQLPVAADPAGNLEPEFPDPSADAIHAGSHRPRTPIRSRTVIAQAARVFHDPAQRPGDMLFQRCRGHSCPTLPQKRVLRKENYAAIHVAGCHRI
jgi:hypothetical protein